MHMYMFVSNYIYSLRPCLFICLSVLISLTVSLSGQSASYSWAFAEVILGYEIVNNESKHAVDPINTGGKKTIYSHLKKYFCGTRFTRLPFLKRLKEKHKLGDACVVVRREGLILFFFFICFDQEIPVVLVFFHRRVLA